MTRQEIEGTPFHTPTVEKALCRLLMEKILNYQSERRSFYQGRLYTARTEILPQSAARMVESWGTLEVTTGTFTVREEVKSILQEHEEWTDFNFE